MRVREIRGETGRWDESHRDGRRDSKDGKMGIKTEIRGDERRYKET